MDSDYGMFDHTRDADNVNTFLTLTVVEIGGHSDRERSWQVGILTGKGHGRWAF